MSKLSSSELQDSREQELSELMQSSNQTKRVVSDELENLLYQPIKILDQGFIRVVDYMGNDGAIAQAARVSYGKGTRTTQDDSALINYLMRHAHTSPFEMCEIKLHIKAPIFIIRQWIRHRTANVNEYSGRYSVMNNEYYLPKEDQLMKQSKSNKQGREKPLEAPYNEQAASLLEQTSSLAFENYDKMLHLGGEESGLSRELSRIVLPLNTYTELYWKIDLHNLLHFVRLRATHHAQYEIRVYAQAILDVIAKWVPLTYEAFKRYRMDAVNLSSEAHKVIKDLLKNKQINREDYSLSKREWKELEDHFELPK